jgi:hypothetical protein
MTGVEYRTRAAHGDVQGDVEATVDSTPVVLKMECA